MFYESELRFFCDTLQCCHIPVTLVNMNDPLQVRMDALQIPASFHFSAVAMEACIAKLPPIQSGVLYRFLDPLNCHYYYFSLPMHPRDTVLVVGPFMTEEPTSQLLMEWAEKHHIPPSQQRQVYEYCSAIPILRDNAQLLAMLDTLGKRLFQDAGFVSEDVSQILFEGFAAEDVQFLEEGDTLWNMKNMEMRYSYENELMDAVSRGHLHKADLLLASFSHFSFEKRSADPVRNLKNYCIIMNTLLRKAAERGGVHPLYLDRTSSRFAFRIEQLSAQQQILPLMEEMFRTYCQLVRKHSMKGYSPPVQKAITLIEADLTENLNLRSLSHSLNVSSSYLSTLFKKETGQTLTDYINRRRVKHAKHLLETTRLQIQTIAQHCGIMDVHYFSKVFKKLTGMTPKAYRDSLHK